MLDEFVPALKGRSFEGMFKDDVQKLIEKKGVGRGTL